MKLALTTAPSASEHAPILLRGPAREAFEAARQAGCQGVELHLPTPESVDRDEVLRLCRESGLAVPTLGTGMAATQDGLTFSSPDPDIRERAVGVILRHIELAAHLGSGVTIGLIFGQAGREAAERRRRLEHAAACLARCAGQAARQGVSLFLEPLNRYESDALNTLADAAAVIRRTGAANVRLLADTFHMNIEEKDPPSALADCRDLLGHIHLADSNREAPGHGHTDFRPILRALREIGYTGFLSFEVLPRPDGQRALADAVAWVTRLLEPSRRREG